jgi:CxC2 like cysteine cluster associated with KDZ transposases
MACCRSSHSSHSFHQIEHWVGEFYQNSWLIETGLTLHFGHGGNPCPFYSHSSHSHNLQDGPFGLPDIPAEVYIPDELDLDSTTDTYMDGQDGDLPAIDPSDNIMFLDPHDQAWQKDDHKKYGNNVLVIVHSNGVPHLPVQWCGCPRHVPNDVQALDLQFFPASFKKAQTLFTFQGLNLFFAENQECKTMAWHYYQKLRRFTSGCFPQNVPVSCIMHGQVESSYEEVVGQILGTPPMHTPILESLKQQGFGHESTEPGLGDLAILHPACLQPGLNLPEDWEDDKEE